VSAPGGLLINVDVPDLERAVAFYQGALGLRLARRLFGGSVAEMAGGACPLYLIEQPAGTVAAAGERRRYHRHWTPVHLDFVVDDLSVALERAVAAGAELEGAVRASPWGRIATLADPFGHGFCLLEFAGRGYREVEHG